MSELIQIRINGAHKEIPKLTLVSQLIEHEKFNGRFIVTLNDELVLKQFHATTYLSTGDRVDILSPITGG